MALTFIVLVVLGNNPEGDIGDPGLAIAVLPLLVNICYTLGWITELAARLLLNRDVPRLATILLIAGLIFTATLPALALLALLIESLVTLVGG